MTRRVEILLVGVSPMMPDPMSDETLEQIRKKGSPPDYTKMPAEQVAALKFYRDKNGVAGIPRDNIIACLVEAGRTVKNPKTKKQISTQGDTKLYELITDFGTEDLIPFANIPVGKKEPNWVMDRRRGVGHNANPPVAVAIIRPRMDEWELKWTIEYDEEAVDRITLLNLFRNAGLSNGLCGARPNKGRMLFGRFKVIDWAETTVEAQEETINITLDGVRISPDGRTIEEAA